MSREKYTTQPTTCLVVFSIACNTAQRRFNVPESKPKKLDVDRPVPKGPLSFARIPVTASSELRSEMELWLEFRARMNGASWYDTTPPRPIHLGNNRFVHRFGRCRPKALWLSGSIPSDSRFSPRVGAIPHQREGSICVVESVKPPSGLPPGLPTNKHHYDGRRQYYDVPHRTER